MTKQGQNTLVSQIKISQPARRAEIVSRPRLVETLHDLLDKKLILLVAPAGYGKTSLLIDLVAKAEFPICWLSLDSLDQEPQRFLTYLITSITQQFPQFGKESLAALQNLTSVEKDSERILINITNEINTTINEHFVLVLDDYHLVDASINVGQLLNRFIKLSGENVHIILSARSLPNIHDMTLMVAHDTVAGLSHEDLAFQTGEIQQFFVQNYQRSITTEEAQKLAQETEGWIAAIHLTGALPAAKRPARLLATSADLFDFFAAEILDKQSPAMREFLLVTALFEAFDADLCRTVLDPLLPGEKRDWPALVAAIQANNLFTVPLGPDRRWMRYHNLFRRFLQARLQYENPTLAWHIQHGLANYYEKQQSWEETLHLYESLGDMDSLVRVFEQAGVAFIRQGRWLTLSNWLKRVPTHLLQEQPILISLQGAILATQGDPDHAVAILNQAESAFRSNRDTENLTLTLTRRAVAYRRRGEINLMLADVDEVINLSQDNWEQNIQESLAEAQRLKGQALHLIGQTETGLKHMETALQLYTELGANTNIPMVEMELGMLHRSLGNNSTAEQYYFKALKVWELSGNMSWQAILLNNLGMLHQIQGDYEKAFTTFEKGLHASEQCGDRYTETLILSSLADLLADINDIEQAQKNQEQASSIAYQLNDSFLIFYSSLTNARLARLGGRIEVAKAALQTLISRPENASPYRQAQIAIEQGCCFLLRGQVPEAVISLKSALKLLEQAGLNEGLCKTHIWLGAALLQSDPAAGINTLEHLSTHNCLNLQPGPLFASTVPILPLLEKNITPGQAGPTLKKFLAGTAEFTSRLPELRRRLRRASQRIQISQPRLEILTLGPAQVIRDGHPISISEWQTRETRDLFFFLVNSQALTKEQIGLAFWPDITPARLKMRFKTNIYRLRHAVGQDIVLFENELYRFNRNIDYTIDLDDFEDLIKASKKSTNDPETVKLLQKAVDLVQGQYLSDIDTEWVMLERTRLQEEYQNALVRLADIYLRLAQIDSSLEISKRALASDPLLEAAHRLRMRAFAAQNDRVAVARQYQQCRTILEAELGIAPSQETDFLYQQLTLTR